LKKLVLIGFVLLLAADFSAQPQKQWTARASEYAVRAYQLTYGKVLSRTGVVRCKFTPSCSRYAIQAFQKYGTLKGAALTASRLVRCSPFSKTQGNDLP